MHLLTVTDFILFQLELRQGEDAFATSTKPAITGKLEERQSPSSHIRFEGKLAGNTKNLGSSDILADKYKDLQCW